MAINSTTARQLCTKTELALFTQSLARNVKSLDERALKSSAARSRKLRDKYRQLADRQDREARGKQQPRRRNPSRGSNATRKKEQIFAETLARFERQLARLDARKSAAPAKGVPAAKKPSGSAAPKAKAARPAAGKRAESKKPAKSSKAAQASGATKTPTGRVSDARKTQIPAAQKSAAEAAKKARIRQSGLTRRQKHLSAQTRRRQARRDRP